MKIPTLISKHGLVLAYVENDAVFKDEEAGYVDDILDCFDLWDGHGSLREYIKTQYAKEIESLAWPEARLLVAQNPDVFNAARLVLDAKIALIEREPEDGLLKVRRLYLQNPQRTVSRMLAAVRDHQGGRYIWAEVRPHKMDESNNSL